MCWKDGVQRIMIYLMSAPLTCTYRTNGLYLAISLDLQKNPLSRTLLPLDSAGETAVVMVQLAEIPGLVKSWSQTQTACLWVCTLPKYNVCFSYSFSLQFSFVCFFLRMLLISEHFCFWGIRKIIMQPHLFRGVWKFFLLLLHVGAHVTASAAPGVWGADCTPVVLCILYSLGRLFLMQHARVACWKIHSNQLTVTVGPAK